ncbi:hypothetical protein STSP2_02779 [Anaerohalosphaera lusitana]|uniref:DUF7305 domain-containing protein n=1 Tax=Anaerohalosphaera lusitana TaxID=1936003 RepID=A0A1U9NPZ7_9BACT|nr:hypothetical protein [Anaerohalosphaera lusitana]AQT69586.1 hypothetical protein STSP2_02779 [Anaerohalosphaera lusitana]
MTYKCIKKSHHSRKGAALALAAMVVVIMLLAGMALLRVGLNSRVYANKTVNELIARSAADAGLNEAFSLMQKKLATSHLPGNSWNNSTLPSTTDRTLDASDATYSYAVSGSPINGFVIASTGECSGQQRTVNVSITTQTPFTGIGVREVIDIKTGVNFYKTPEDGLFILRTNSSETGCISINSWVTVPGDVVIGPGGIPETSIDTKSNTVIEGGSYSATEEINFPPVYAPSGLPLMEYQQGNTITLNSSGQYEGITIGNGETLMIDDGVPGTTKKLTIYISGDLILNNGASMILAEGTALDLYLGGNWEDKNSSSAGGFFNENTISDPITAAQLLHVYGLPGCEKISFKAKSDFAGAVYAPDADLILHNSGDIYGAFVGNNFEMKNSSSFTYVADLMNGMIDDPITVFARQRWWED